MVCITSWTGCDGAEVDTGFVANAGVGTESYAGGIDMSEGDGDLSSVSGVKKYVSSSSSEIGDWGIERERVWVGERGAAMLGVG